MQANNLLRTTLLAAAFAAGSTLAFAGGQDLAANSGAPHHMRPGGDASWQQKTLEQLLKEIHKTYKVDLLYESRKLPKVKVNFKPSDFDDVEEMLQALLHPHGLQAQ